MEGKKERKKGQKHESSGKVSRNLDYFRILGLPKKGKAIEEQLIIERALGSLDLSLKKKKKFNTSFPLNITLQF